jgi:hypothetical protein
MPLTGGKHMNKIIAFAALFLVAGGLFAAKASEKGIAEHGCPVNETKMVFIDECRAYMAYRDTKKGREIDRIEIGIVCTCIGVNFGVENIPRAPICKFKPSEMEMLLGIDTVQSCFKKAK